MSQSEDEAVEDETEWRSSLVDSLSVSPGTTATGKVKAEGKHKGWGGRWFCVVGGKLDTGLSLAVASWLSVLKSKTLCVMSCPPSFCFKSEQDTRSMPFGQSRSPL